MSGDGTGNFASFDMDENVIENDLVAIVVN